MAEENLRYLGRLEQPARRNAAISGRPAPNFTNLGWNQARTRLPAEAETGSAICERSRFAAYRGG